MIIRLNLLQGSSKPLKLSPFFSIVLRTWENKAFQDYQYSNMMFIFIHYHFYEVPWEICSF